VSAADLANERLLEQATLAQTYFEIRGQDALQQLLDETVKADESVLEVTQGLYDTGLDNQVSLEQAKQTLESARATATNAHIARVQYEHAIATLLGKNATDFKVPERPFVTAPPAIPVGTPSELLERRPDVAAAERQMAQANAVIGIGQAAFYPTLTLSADGGFNNSSFIHWFSWPSRFFSIGPSISETVFDAGLRRATLDQYVATYNADLASYRQTVLTAFQQVEDYLAETRILSAQIQQAQAAMHSAELAFELEKNRYQTGLDPYVTLLTTQTALLATRQSLVSAQVQQMNSAVLLVEALGGGWDKADLATVKQVSEKPTQSDRQIQH
jgi:NodT family efflux transporter outer membrane factor (OMF) lipoprotein